MTLRSLLVYACAARAFAVTRVTEHTGTKTPGGDNDLWDTPEKKAPAVSRSGQWRGYRPRPLQPNAATTADPNSYGCRPQRRCAHAVDQCLQVLRQHTAATWIVAGDSAGFCDHIAFAWLDTHLPMTKRVLSQWLKSGLSDHGAVCPTTAGVPQGGILSPVISHMGRDGLEDVVHGGTWHRRVHKRNDVRWADDVIVTANAREV